MQPSKNDNVIYIISKIEDIKEFGRFLEVSIIVFLFSNNLKIRKNRLKI